MKRLPKAVIFLSIASFFTDFSSEMIYPLLPVFLSTVLGAGALALGVIEGIAESTAALFKVVSGVWADRTHRRKPFILGGYGLAGIVRPLIGLATGWPFVLVMRFVDRIGKGLRTSPRDALIADVADPKERGKAFGFHRAADHAGAVVGPLVAAALLSLEALPLRLVFFLAAIPAAVVMLVLFFGVKESEPVQEQRVARAAPSLREHWGELGQSFKFLLLALLIFTLGNSTDAFLILRLSSVGVDPSWIALLWAAHHVVKMVSTYTGGRLSDGVGSRSMIVTGWIVYAAIYFGFAVVDSSAGLIALFLAYGIYFGLTEPSEKSWVAELVPANLRGTAFGYYHGVMGLGALPASLLFGFLWHSFGVSTAFITGAGLALLGALLLFLVKTGPELAFEKELPAAASLFRMDMPAPDPVRSDFDKRLDD